ncbi:MAG TPA: M48 family metalloprotease [Verrucomicrobiae bacterium]|jgi:hypothetical protein|nr:M48 family metalloprotease [Verrucomicrobiae bacterium]
MDRPDTILEPLPYHLELRDYLKSRERELWNWFASAKAKADYTDHLRLELLKSTYRLDAQGHPELYKALDEARASLGLDIPVTLYQAQHSPESNASLFFVPGEGHVVFAGPLLTLLNQDEIKSVIGHELAHYHLWERDNGEFFVADRLVQAVALDPRAAACHEQTARRYQLYTEIFADRGALCITGDIHPVVAGLVKTQTGLAQVSAAGYLKQAEEIFAQGNVATQGLSHPEAFIRARSLMLWQEKRDEAATHINHMIEGAAALDDLDLIGQMRLTGLTRRLLEHLLRPRWFQTPAVLGHAKLYFDDFVEQSRAREQAADPSLTVGSPSDVPADLKFTDAKLREYFCYVLLDFAKVDPNLDDMPLTATLHLSQQLELDAQFEKLAAKELGLKIRDMKKLKEHAAETLAKAEANGE